MKRKVAITADHAGFAIKEIIKKYLIDSGYEVKDYGEDFYKKIKPGRRPSVNRQFNEGLKLTRKSSAVSKAALPSKFDSRDIDGKAYIGPVRDQGPNGTCYSFGACAAAEGVFNKTYDLYDENAVDFSESYIAWSLGTISPYSDHFYGGEGADYEYAELTALTLPGEGTGCRRKQGRGRFFKQNLCPLSVTMHSNGYKLLPICIISV